MESIQERDYQVRIFNKTTKYFEDDIPSVCIVSSTGSGKTIMAMQFLKWVEENYPDFTVNWVAMRKNLLRQAAEENNSKFGLKNIRFVSMFDNNPPKADIIVSDEGHHASCASFCHISNYDVKFLLGLSATPIRVDKLKLPFQKTIQDASIHRLIQEGWLSQYEHWCMEQYTPKSIAEAYLKDKERWGKSVAFFHQVAQCEEFQGYLAKNGVKCEVVHGASSNATREDQLDRFDENDYPIIANVAILTEGFDCPDLRTVFVRDSSRLPTIQMSGRGFRIFEGKTHCNIVQSKLTKWQFTRTAKPKRSWVQKDGEWFALGSNAKVNTIVKEMVHKLIEIEVEMPSFILKNRAKKRIFQRA